MNELQRCPKCDAEIPANSPIGLCPRCLLKAANDSQSVAASVEPGPTKITPPASGFIPPSVEELAPLFPQLEILELLGKGGMGAVYKARQPGLDRLVAIKILPPEISRDPTFAERFQREARALARLSHPQIVAVYDFGQVRSELISRVTMTELEANRMNAVTTSEGGLCYIVMEFVDGANLRQTIQSKKLTPAEALAIVPQICEALQFAHDEGIVHRDIKPENILIDKRGRVKIADFGLAKLMANGGRESPVESLTATHQVMGTLRYMAPEQMQGSREVDHRADIYSLGVVFYELLTGELPMGKFAPPSKKVQVDVRLDEVVLRALEQDPKQRYQHASDVKEDLEEVARIEFSPTSFASRAATPDLRSVVNALTSHAAAETQRHMQQFASGPRFSRFAIAGAVWALFGLVAIIPTLYFIGLNRVWNGTALPTDVIHSEPPLAFSIFMGTLLAIGAGAPIGTTILGAVSIGHIKRSEGRIIGLPLAVFDACFFPALFIGGMISAFTHLAQIALWTQANTGYLYESGRLKNVISPNLAIRPDTRILSINALAFVTTAAVAFYWAWRRTLATYHRRESVSVQQSWNPTVSRAIQSEPKKNSEPQESLPYLLGWLAGWLLRERWFVMILQTVTALIYAFCLIAFFSSHSTNTPTPQGSVTRYLVGQPSAWLTMESSASSQQVNFEVFTLTHVVALIGLAALAVTRWLERRSSNKVHSMNWHYVIWGLFFAATSGFGLKILSDATHRRQTLMTSTNQFEALPPLGTINNGIGVEFRVPAGQVAVLEIVTRRDGQTVPVQPHCCYVLAPSDHRLAATFRWSRASASSSNNKNYEPWNLELKTAGGGGGFSGGLLLPNELSQLVGSRGIQLGDLAPNEEVIHWGTLDANNLPDNGLIGLRFTVTAHHLKTSGGSGIGHIDWKKTQSATSTTRRKLP